MASRRARRRASRASTRCWRRSQRRPAPRSRAQRKADTLALLRAEVECWVASADELGSAHLVPLCHYWDGAALVLATPRSSPTTTNLLRDGVARVGVGPKRDVVLVDGPTRRPGSPDEREFLA